jgi:PAS domain S-box-containing protein
MFNSSSSFNSNGQLRLGLFICLLSVWLLAGVLSYLNHYTKRKYFSIWTVAWLFYSLYLTLSYVLFWHYGDFRGEPWWGTMTKQWCLGISAVFMLWGSLRFLGSRVRRVPLMLFSGFLLIWGFVANYPGSDDATWDKSRRMALQMPLFVLLGLASMVGVWGFLRYRRKRRYLGAGLLSLGFLFWALFVAAYPFLERLPEYMSTGFVAASVLQSFIAVNMIILVLEQLRHTRERRTAMQLRSGEREKSLLQSRIVVTEERYRRLFEHARDAIVITTVDGLKILELNQEACRLLGVCAAEAQNQSLNVAFSRDSNAAPNDASSAVEWLEGPRVQQLSRKDGTLIDAEVSASPIDFGGAPALQFYLRELTEINQLGQQLRRAEKLSSLGQMISGVVHELNNPLTVSGSLLELMLLDKGLPKPIQDRLKTAAREHRRATRLLRNFLGLAREGGAETQNVNLNEVVQDVLELRRSEFAKADVEICLRLDPELPKIQGSLDQIQQVIIILLNNALQAMETVSTAKCLRVVTRAEPGMVTLLVEDNGPGVPSHLRSRIFEPFFTTKPAGVGTGLGLSMAHSYMSEHRGRIYCEPSPLGGALFGIELPALHLQPPRPAAVISRLKFDPQQPALPEVDPRLSNASV